MEKAVQLRDEIEGELEPAGLIEAQQMAADLFVEKTWMIETSK